MVLWWPSYKAVQIILICWKHGLHLSWLFLTKKPEKCLKIPFLRCHFLDIFTRKYIFYTSYLFFVRKKQKGDKNGTWVYKGSYMSAHVLLNLLNELWKRDKMRGLPSILSLFRNEFNKFNNTRARMLDSNLSYGIKISFKSRCWR